MFFYRVTPPTDPFAGSTSFTDDFSSASLDLTNWSKTYEFVGADADLIDQTLLTNPLPGVAKALRLQGFTNGGYNASLKLTSNVASGALVNYANTKAISIRGFIRYNNPNPSALRTLCGLTLKTNNLFDGYSVTIGDGTLSGQNLALISKVGYSEQNLSVYHPVSQDTWYGVRIDLVASSPTTDAITVYSRSLPTDSWTLLSTQTIGSGYISWDYGDPQQLGFSFQASSYNAYPAAYLANFEVYIKNAPI